MLRSLAKEVRTAIAAYLVLAIGLAAVAAVTAYVDRAVMQQQAAHFEALSRTALADVGDRMEAYLSALRAARGIFRLGHPPTRRDFHLFVDSLALEEHYPGIQGIGYAQVVTPGELAAHERAVREEGFSGYHVWPPGPRDVYTSIVYIEPFDWRNQRAFGYDMLSEPVRRAAMERARDSGEAACSARVELVQEAGSERQAGFLIYLPVYAGEATDTASRRARLLGFVYAPFRADDLLRGTLASDQLAQLDVEVFDGDAADPGALLFRSRPQDGAVAGRLSRLEHIAVAGRPWTVRQTAAPTFAARWERWLPRFVALAGLLLSYLLFRLTRGEVRSRAEAQRAAGRALFLADAGKALTSSLDYRATLAAVAHRAAEDQADWCVVLLVEPDGPVRLFGHRDRAAARQAEALGAGLLLDPDERFGAAAALRRAEPFLAQAVDDEALQRISRTPAQLEALREARLASILTVPLRARGEALGAITLASSDPRRRFDAADLGMAEDLARIASAAVDTSRLYARAQEAVRIRDEFLSIASHELKTPLTSLALQSESLRTAVARAGGPEALVRKADVIRRNVERLNRLIANLLDISRIGAGRLALEPEELDLAEVVRDVAARFEDEAQRARCDLRLALGGPVPGRWDRLRLDQVITNLVSNAVKYGPGRPVTVALRPEGDRVLLTVTDEGIGISPEDQGRIFERFERAVSERHYGGFGLGLWIVRRIVEAMGGEIHVESTPGRGATFTVALQRLPPDETRPAGEPTPPAAQTGAW